MSIDYASRIPNNVDLSGNRALQRALEHWQPGYQAWWAEMGPEGSRDFDVYLRTAVSVDAKGWANFDYVKMPDYRWGIFLAAPEPGRTVNFGAHKGEPAWQEVPGEHRANLRRLIVTQGDTEPASVEQQRHLGLTAPSLYDLRNLFQVNVEEGRHLWAMVYLLHAHFGRDGREEAEALLERRSGDADNPRILGAFNERTPDWLSFFCFTTYTDRDGKFQLLALAESGFDPLARTCRFMLTEEAHHMFVGQTGVGRVIQKTCEVMRAHPGADVKAYGAIPLEVIQRYVNYWNSSSNDLFGAEISSNSANFFRSGLKGRAYEDKQADHLALEGVYAFENLVDGKLVSEQVPLRNAMNEVLRDEYVHDNEKGVAYWNKIVEKAEIDFRFCLPHRRFNRSIGVYSGQRCDLDGNPIGEEQWNRRVAEWLPTPADRAYVASLMLPVREPGRFAGWIAAPQRGINSQPIEMEYVKL